jgi:hypothetical protein
MGNGVLALTDLYVMVCYIKIRMHTVLFGSSG